MISWTPETAASSSDWDSHSRVNFVCKKHTHFRHCFFRMTEFLPLSSWPCSSYVSTPGTIRKLQMDVSTPRGWFCQWWTTLTRWQRLGSQLVSSRSRLLIRNATVSGRWQCFRKTFVTGKEYQGKQTRSSLSPADRQPKIENDVIFWKYYFQWTKVIITI